jgi:hypothetical protein
MGANSSTPPPEAVLLACSKCGAALPEEAQFCLKCGKPVSLPAKKLPAAVAIGGTMLQAPQAGSAQPKRKRRFVLWLLLVLFFVAFIWATTSDNPFAQGLQELAGFKHDQTILQEPFSVSAHSIRYYKFALPEGSLHVSILGEFAASSESGSGQQRNTGQTNSHQDKTKGADADNNIEVYVLSEPAFTVWQNGYATSSVYESGRVSQGRLQSELPAGAGIYYLVFSNKFSPKTAKSVNATVLLRYKSWVPGWFRKFKEWFWNWTGL